MSLSWICGYQSASWLRSSLPKGDDSLSGNIKDELGYACMQSLAASALSARDEEVEVTDAAMEAEMFEACSSARFYFHISLN